MKDQDQNIVAMIRSRKQEGLQQMLECYGPLIRYVIMPVLQDHQDLEDCVSEISMTVWNRIEMYDPKRGSFRAWVTAISRNHALNCIRKKKIYECSEEIPDIASSEATPEEMVVEKELQATVRKALAELSDGERMLIYRKYYYMQSTEQIACETGMSPRAVEGRLYRIRKRLKKIMGGEGYERQTD